MVRWICSLAALAALVLLAVGLYLGTLLPDTFLVAEGGTLAIAGMPFLTMRRFSGRDVTAQAQRGASFNTSLLLGGLVPVKTVRAEVVARRVVQVCGTPFGIKMFANGAMVVGFSDIGTATGSANPAKTAGLQMGDVITSVAGKPTRTNEDVAAALQTLGGAPAEVVYERDGVARNTLLTAVYDDAVQSWRTGMWVRDSSAGIGTLTFVDAATGVFAGLGHSIHDVDTGATITLRQGEIVPVSITGYTMGTQGVPGELQGRFTSAVPTGNITVNGETGVYGTTRAVFGGFEAEAALAQEVRPGAAVLYTTIDGTAPQKYSVVIEKIALNAENPNRNMVVRVTDKHLLAQTGGIVQGMSGSPILQGGRFVGAVTHVLVNDPTRGYGIFAENMLSTADAAVGQASRAA